MLTREARTKPAPAEAAQPMRALFVADWVDAVFLQYAVAPRELQPFVPFELDTFAGDAYVSLVAFTQRRLRPTIGGRLAAMLSTPLACHEFLNVRTYVRDAASGEVGIHFLAEWIPNRLAALIGPPMYGLPYRVGRLDYQHDVARGRFGGIVSAPGGRVEFDGSFDVSSGFRPARPDTLAAFLIERYTAWTHRHGVARRFRIRHAPWPQARARVNVHRADLLAGLCDGMLVNAQPDFAQVSPGAYDVAIGPPVRVSNP